MDQEIQISLVSNLSDHQNLEITIQELRQQITHLQIKLQQVTSQISEPNHVGKPKQFRGNPGELYLFLVKCNTIFNLQPQRYDLDEKKVGFIATYLDGPPLAWYAGLCAQKIPILSNIKEFIREFEVIFGDPMKENKAQLKLEYLRQGQNSVAAYISTFQQIIMDLDYTDKALISYFRRGLREEIKELLIILPPPPFFCRNCWARAHLRNAASGTRPITFCRAIS